jgi:hypothetical protein
LLIVAASVHGGVYTGGCWEGWRFYSYKHVDDDDDVDSCVMLVFCPSILCVYLTSSVIVVEEFIEYTKEDLGRSDIGATLPRQNSYTNENT